MEDVPASQRYEAAFWILVILLKANAAVRICFIGVDFDEVFLTMIELLEEGKVVTELEGGRSVTVPNQCLNGLLVL